MVNMQLSLQVFEYEGGHKVRTTEIDGQIWFYAVDVCSILELSNVSKSVSALDEDEKLTITNSEGRAGTGAQGFLVINEPGLYSMILRSRKPEAKVFKRWVTHDVLPTIRRTGSYALANKASLPIFVRRFNDNWDRVRGGHFSVISELFIRLYGRLEHVGHRMADYGSNGSEIRPDVSVGRLFPAWLKANYPKFCDEYDFYSHKLPTGLPVKARQYKHVSIKMKFYLVL
jgi:hypothetical protein